MASPRVGAARRPRTGSTKQSRCNGDSTSAKSALVLSLWHADDKPVERLAHRDLAGEAGVGLGQRGKAQHAGFLRPRDRGAGDAEPALVDIDVAGRTGALA